VLSGLRRSVACRSWRGDTFLSTTEVDDSDATVVLLRRHLLAISSRRSLHAAVAGADRAGRVAWPSPGNSRRAGLCAAAAPIWRPAWSSGARGEALRTLNALRPSRRSGVPIIGLEPSCLFTLRDEFLALGLGEDAEQVAGHAMLFEEFLARAKTKAGRLDLALKPLAEKSALLHGHCHQKAFGAMSAVQEALALVPDLKVTTIESSCCGMAGSFGYEAEHYETSIAMAEALAAAGGARRCRRCWSWPTAPPAGTRSPTAQTDRRYMSRRCWSAPSLPDHLHLIQLRCGRPCGTVRDL
jgi:hypothetical protein